MAETSVRVRNLTGDQSAWSSSGAVIGRGEIAVELNADHTRLKVGNGTDTFNDLDYPIASSTVLDYLKFGRDSAPEDVPNKALFVDENDGVLKFKDATGAVRLINLT